eukprot:SAG31_NODE_17289_length_676_cov_1.493934_1_plen_51_part_00
MRVVIFREWSASPPPPGPEWYTSEVTRVIGVHFYVKFDHEEDDPVSTVEL